MNNHRPSPQCFNPVIPPSSCTGGANASRGAGLNMVTPALDKLNRLLRTQDAAKIVGLSPRTLECYRGNGGGPPYLKIRDLRRGQGSAALFVDRPTRQIAALSIGAN